MVETQGKLSIRQQCEMLRLCRSVCLVAIMGWYSRRVLSWRLSRTLETRFCIDALQEALELHGKPDIFNSDQGSQFTDAFHDSLATLAA